MVMVPILVALSLKVTQGGMNHTTQCAPILQLPNIPVSNVSTFHDMMFATEVCTKKGD